MEKQYQLFYRHESQVRKINLRATCEDMAKKFVKALLPECEVIYVTDDPIPMTCEYVRNWMAEKDELLSNN